MTNVDLDSFLPIEDFFRNIGVPMNTQIVENIKNAIKKESIEIDNKVYSSRRNKIMWSLNQSGCDWIDYKIYSKTGNDFYHVDSNCSRLRDNLGRLEEYATIIDALHSGKHTYCRTCCKKD